jgi:hypothetical protein
MSTAVQPASKMGTKIALINLDEAANSLLAECFRQFKIQTIPVKDSVEERLRKEKFEGIVLRLSDPQADSILKAARSSPSNRAMVLYGIADFKTALKYSAYGINAVLTEPLDRNAALKAVRGTYLLAVHEFRRYVRIPVAVEVDIDAEGQRVAVLSQEVSSGGMSLQAQRIPATKKPVTASFTLPGAKTTTVKANICWRRENTSMFGIRFEHTDPSRRAVRDWIEKFLETI